MGAAGLESHSMVGVDTSRPELPGLPTNESANTIPRRSRAFCCNTVLFCD